jgi:hypothetical protein
MCSSPSPKTSPERLVGMSYDTSERPEDRSPQRSGSQLRADDGFASPGARGTRIPAYVGSVTNDE